MSRNEHPLDPGHDLVNARALGVENVDFHQTVPVVKFQRPGCRYINGVVQIEAQHGPFRFHNANYTVTITTYTNKFTQWTSITEEFLAQFAPKDRKSTGRTRIIGRQERAHCNIEFEDRGKFVCNAVDRRPSLPVTGFDLRVALYERDHTFDLRYSPQRLAVIDRKRPHRAKDSYGAPHRRGFARIDADDVGAELRKLSQDKPVNAFANRSQQHYGCNTDRDSKRR